MQTHATSIADWVIVAPVVLALFGAGVLLALRGVLRIQAWACAAIVIAVLVCELLLLRRVLAEGPLVMTMGRWLPPFGISFAADALGAGLALVASAIALAVVVALATGTPESARRDGLYPLVLLLLAGTNGAFLTGDMFNLYVWFEVSLIAAFGLLVLAGNPVQLDAAIKYAVPNFIATSMLLLALGLLYGLFGTLNMADLAIRQAKADPATLTAIAALFTLAFGIKAAAFPVNAWLPASYHVPPAPIAALMAGLLTKVGIYALLRTLVFVLPLSLVALKPLLVAVAVATALLAPLGAIAETRPRRAIGFILIGGIGVILAGVASPNLTALSGASLYIAHGMLTIAALYLVSGLIDVPAEGEGTAGGWLIGACLLVLLLGAAGIPPFLGFWPKLLLLQGLLEQAGLAGGGAIDIAALGLAAAVLLNAFLTLVAGARLWSRLYWKSPVVASTRPSYSTVAALGLAGLVFVAGLWPNPLVTAAQHSASGLLDRSAYVAAVGLAP